MKNGKTFQSLDVQIWLKHTSNDVPEIADFMKVLSRGINTYKDDCFVDLLVCVTLKYCTFKILADSIVILFPQVSDGDPCPVGQSYASEAFLLEVWPEHFADRAAALGPTSQLFPMGPLAF